MGSYLKLLENICYSTDSRLFSSGMGKTIFESSLKKALGEIYENIDPFKIEFLSFHIVYDIYSLETLLAACVAISTLTLKTT